MESEIPTVELTDEYWITEIEMIKNSTSYVGVAKFNDRVLQLVASKLNFGKNQRLSDPNELRESTAHCVGYAALNASLLNYYYAGSTYEIAHVRGKIKFLGYDLTNLSKSKFWKNHDFVRIKNNKLNKEYFSDGSLYEYLKISSIGLKYPIYLISIFYTLHLALFSIFPKQHSHYVKHHQHPRAKSNVV